MLTVGDRPTLGDGGGDRRGGLERVRGDGADGQDRGRVPAEEVDDDGLGRGAGRVQDPGRHDSRRAAWR